MQPNSTTEPPSPVRRCVRCLESKTTADFFRRPHSELLRAHCKACHNKDRKDWRPDRMWHTKARSLGKRHGGVSVGPAALRKALGQPSDCYLCGDMLIWSEAAVDHVLPVQRGGTLSFDNLAWCHRICNAIKGGLTIDELKPVLRRILDHLSRLDDPNGPSRRSGSALPVSPEPRDYRPPSNTCHTRPVPAG